MSATITPPGATTGGVTPSGTTPATVTPAPPPSGPIRRALAAFRQGITGTPGRLRLAAGASIVAALIAGLGGAYGLQQRSAALTEAQLNAEDLVVLQTVRTSLVQADADATNSFLSGGLEPVAQRRDYMASLAQASKDLAVVARRASDEDLADLSRVNDALTQYAGLVESARSLNRQQLPIGASYLKVASALMSDQILPGLAAVANRESERADDAFDRSSMAWLLLTPAAVLGLGVLIGVQVWLARRSRRVLNVPAALSTAALVVVLGAGVVVMAVAQSEANDVRDGAYGRAVMLGLARVEAYDAKSIEALTLISRGSGTPEDPEWTAAIGRSMDALGAARDTTSLVAQLNVYVEQHKAIRELDNAGQWDRAVAAATNPDPGSANATFQEFATASGNQLRQAADATASGLDEAHGGLVPVAWLALLVGLVAAAGAWWGISLRLDEYR